MSSSRDLEQACRPPGQNVEKPRESQSKLDGDLDATARLLALGSLFLREGNLAQVLGEVVETAQALVHADFGNVQLLDPAGDLRIAAQRGFPAWWIEFWDVVSKGHGTCGTALEGRERVVVEDVERSPIFAGTPALEVQLRAGVRAVQSTPLPRSSGPADWHAVDPLDQAHPSE